MKYPIIVEIDFEAEDEVELTAFINHLLKFFGAERIRVRRIVSTEEERDSDVG
jgi:hypothetical protein